MSDLRLVYLSGEPGVGKSTLMRQITEDWTRIYMPKEMGGPPCRDLLFDHARPAQAVAVELGRIRDTFSGTDALPSSVIGEAELWLTSGRAAREAPLVLAEGARLANRRFLTCAVTTGYRVQLLHLSGLALAAQRRATRARTLGKPEQNPSWVKGRRTAAANLALAAPDWGVESLVVDAEKLTTDDTYRNAVIVTARGTLHTGTPPR